MAAKKHATNGKAKREKLESFDTGCLPPPCRTLTPKRAAQWLKKDFRHWQDLANRAAAGGNESTWLRDSIGYVVDACTRAIESGRPVELRCTESSTALKAGRLPSYLPVIEHLELLAAALRAPVDEEYEFTDMQPAVLALLADLLEVAKHGQRELEIARDDRRAEAESRKKLEDPYRRIDELNAQRRALTAEAERAREQIEPLLAWRRDLEAIDEEILAIHNRDLSEKAQARRAASA